MADNKNILSAVAPEDLPYLDKNVSYQEPTKDVRVATGVSPEGSAPTAGLMDWLPGYGVAKDVGGAVVDVAKTANESGVYGKSAQQQNVALPTTQQEAIDVTTKNLPLSEVKAEQGLEKGAVIQATGEQKQAEQTKSAIEKLIGGGVFDPQKAIDLNNNLREAVATSKEADDSLKAFADLPNSQKIDPTRYVKNLGVSGRTLSAFGMVLGGIGAGLTGGPNLAAQNFQNNIQRDIAAQKESNEQNMMALAQRQKIALDKVQMANISTASNNLAQHTALTGLLAVANQGINVAKSSADKERAKAIAFQLQQQLANSEVNIANMIKGYIQSGNTESLKLFAEMLKNAGYIKSEFPNKAVSAPSPQPSEVPTYLKRAIETGNVSSQEAPKPQVKSDAFGNKITPYRGSPENE